MEAWARGSSHRWADEAAGELGSVGLVFGYYHYSFTATSPHDFAPPRFVGTMLGRLNLSTAWAPLRVSLPAAERPCLVSPAEAPQGLYGEAQGQWHHHLALVVEGGPRGGSVWLDDVDLRVAG